MKLTPTKLLSTKYPTPKKIELRDPLLNVLTTKAEDILADDYVNDKAIEEKAI